MVHMGNQHSTLENDDDEKPKSYKTADGSTGNNDITTTFGSVGDGDTSDCESRDGCSSADDEDARESRDECSSPDDEDEPGSDVEEEYFYLSFRTKLKLTSMPLSPLLSQEELSFQKQSHSILVFTKSGIQLGKLQRKAAVPLSEILDRNLATMEDIEGRVLISGMTNKHLVPVEVSIFCNNDDVENLRNILDDNRIQISSLERCEDPEDSDDTMSEKRLQDKLDRLFEDMQDKNRPIGQAEPLEVIETKLQAHQKEALYWMLEKENSDDLPPFWKEKGDSFFNTLTDETMSGRPNSIRGGILADDMGLGKTLVVISLIVTNTMQNCNASKCSPNVLPRRAGGCDKVSDKKDEVPKCSGQSSVIYQNEMKGEKEDPLAVNDSSDTASDSGNDCWRSPSRKRKYSEIVIIDDSSDEADTNEETPVIFMKIKRNSERKRRTGSHVKPKQEEKGSELMYNSDSVIVISDDEESVCQEEHSRTEDNLEEDEDVGFMPIIDNFEKDIEECMNAEEQNQDKRMELKPTAEATMTIFSQTESKATMIVCPKTVLRSTWQKQFETHLREGSRLNLYAFHGPNRNTDVEFLARKDVVLTTYGTVLADCKTKKCLERISWFRIILDEGHEIRNPSAQTTVAICSLQTGRKWVLSVIDTLDEFKYSPIRATIFKMDDTMAAELRNCHRTPIQNRLKDLWSLINFLEIHPLTDRRLWRKAIEWPMMDRKETAFRRLQHLVSTIAMRRTKEILKLPKRTETIQKLQFSEEENAVYRDMHDNAKILLDALLAEGVSLDPQTYRVIFISQLRLRQMCCHPALFQHAKKAVSYIIALRGGMDEDRRRYLVKKLQKVLKSEHLECPICLDDWKSPVITPCKHVYCRTCIEDVLGTPGENPTCPMCRATLDASQLIQAKPQDLEPDEQIDVSVNNFKHSAKTRALMKSLLKLRDEDQAIKSMVVSFFTTFLDIIEIPLRDKGFRFVRLDGKMSMANRETAVSSFMDTGPGSPTIILLSLRAGGQGITLTSATRVFLMEPWFNPATEQQCFDRCHRLGQTKDVVITKFIMEDSIEEGLLECQKQKLELMREAFRKPSAQEKKLQTIQHFRTAFGL